MVNSRLRMRRTALLSSETGLYSRDECGVRRTNLPSAFTYTPLAGTLTSPSLLTDTSAPLRASGPRSRSQVEESLIMSANGGTARLTSSILIALSLAHLLRPLVAPGPPAHNPTNSLFARHESGPSSTPLAAFVGECWAENCPSNVDIAEDIGGHTTAATCRPATFGCQSIVAAVAV